MSSGKIYFLPIWYVERFYDHAVGAGLAGPGLARPSDGVFDSRGRPGLIFFYHCYVNA